MNVAETDKTLEWIPEGEYVGGLWIQKSIADDLGIDVTQIRTADDFFTTCLLRSKKAVTKTTTATMFTRSGRNTGAALWTLLSTSALA